MVLRIFSADFAVEWLRPLPPDSKLVGPLLPQPAAPLPRELEVSAWLSFSQRCCLHATCLGGQTTCMEGVTQVRMPKLVFCCRRTSCRGQGTTVC